MGTAAPLPKWTPWILLAASASLSAASPDPVVGKVLGKEIHAQDVAPCESPDAGTALERSYCLMPFFFWPIYEDFGRRKGVRVTDNEADEFDKALGPTGIDDRMRDEPPDVRAAYERENRRLARETVRAWKISRALYRDYGGTVIFQQSNPVEPVGAYRKLLEQREREGALAFLDKQVAEDFWFYFRMEHPMQSSAKDPFASPWWHAPK